MAPPVEDGLIIEGIATTRDWNAIEVPLAAGLKTLDGRTTTRQRGLVPRNCEVELPLPLLWLHDWDKKIGELFALSATDLAVHFKACIVPPGTANYDSALLEQVWADVRSGKATGVSFHTALERVSRWPTGKWRGVELSVCPTGGNPFAVITRAVFPDKHIVTRATPKFNLQDAQRVWLAFDASHRAAQQQSKPQVVKEIVMHHDEHGMPTGATVTEATGVVTHSTVVRDDTGRISGLTTVKVEQPKVSAHARGIGALPDTAESVPLRCYKFVWRPTGQYDRGDLVTHGGKPWICLTVSGDRPGTSKSWRLMSKSDLSELQARAGS